MGFQHEQIGCNDYAIVIWRRLGRNRPDDGMDLSDLGGNYGTPGSNPGGLGSGVGTPGYGPDTGPNTGPNTGPPATPDITPPTDPLEVEAKKTRGYNVMDAQAGTPWSAPGGPPGSASVLAPLLMGRRMTHNVGVPTNTTPGYGYSDFLNTGMMGANQADPLKPYELRRYRSPWPSNSHSRSVSGWITLILIPSRKR